MGVKQRSVLTFTGSTSLVHFITFTRSSEYTCPAHCYGIRLHLDYTSKKNTVSVSVITNDFCSSENSSIFSVLDSETWKTAKIL